MRNTDCDYCNGMGFLSAEQAAGQSGLRVNGLGLPVCPRCHGRAPVNEIKKTVPRPGTTQII